MKKVCLLAACLLLRTLSFSQNIQFLDFILLKKQGFEKASESLAKKHYKFYRTGGNDSTGSQTGERYFIEYSYNGLQDYNFSECYFYLVRDGNNDYLPRLGVRLADKEKFDNLLIAAKNYGYVLQNSEVQQNSLKHYYSNGQFSLEVSETATEDEYHREKTYYVMMLCDITNQNTPKDTVVNKGVGLVEAPNVKEDYDKDFKTVQVPAKFPGGASAWQAFLQRNLNADTVASRGAPPGNYTVVLSFMVYKDGSVSEVMAENNPGYGTAEEAVRVLKLSGNWVPAIQNGRPVMYRQKQSITFFISKG